MLGTNAHASIYPFHIGLDIKTLNISIARAWLYQSNHLSAEICYIKDNAMVSVFQELKLQGGVNPREQDLKDPCLAIQE